LSSLSEDEGPSWLRVCAGLLIAPAVPALLSFLGQVIIGKSNSFLMAPFLLLYGYPLALVLGVPVYLFVRWRKVRRPAPFIGLGALIGLLGYVAFFLLTSAGPVYTNELRLALLRNTAGLSLLGVVCGAISGLVFWFVVIKSRD